MAIGIDIYNKDILLHEGKLSFVSKSDKVKRDLKKMLATDSCTLNETTDHYRYNREYGLLINKRELFKGLSRSAILDTVKLLLSSGLSNYVSLQEQRTNLSLEEIIRDINFYAIYKPDDRSKIIITIVATLITNETVNLGTYEQSI